MAASQREDPRGLDDLDTPHTPPMRPPPSYASLTAALEPAPSQGYGSLASEANEHQFMHLGLPSGVFLIRSKAAGQRTLDVRAQGTAEGTEICLHSVKQPVIQRHSTSLLNPENNQLFYVAWTGSLQSASAEGKGVDCLDDALSLSFPKPIFPIASPESHPLPQFSLDPYTSTLHVLFACDPTYPGPTTSAPASWKEIEYVVEAVPSKRKREEPANPFIAVSTGILSGIGKGFGGFSLFGKSSTPVASPSIVQQANEASTSTGTPPRPSHSLTIDTESGDESDDDLDAYRSVRVVALPSNWREKIPPEVLNHSASSQPSNGLGIERSSSKEQRKWLRRQWEVVPVVVRRVETVSHPLPPLPLPIPAPLPIVTTPSRLAPSPAPAPIATTAPAPTSATRALTLSPSARPASQMARGASNDSRTSSSGGFGRVMGSPLLSRSDSPSFSASSREDEGRSSKRTSAISELGTVIIPEVEEQQEVEDASREMHEEPEVQEEETTEHKVKEDVEEPLESPTAVEHDHHELINDVEVSSEVEKEETAEEESIEEHKIEEAVEPESPPVVEHEHQELSKDVEVSSEVEKEEAAEEESIEEHKIEEAVEPESPPAVEDEHDDVPKHVEGSPRETANESEVEKETIEEDKIENKVEDKVSEEPVSFAVEEHHDLAKHIEGVSLDDTKAVDDGEEAATEEEGRTRVLA